MKGWATRLVLCLLLFAATPLTAQRRQAVAKDPAAVPVLMLSDVHFDPFRDPAKLSQLRSTPVEGWPAILEAPRSATQAVALERLQGLCGAHGLDTDWRLFKQSLEAMRVADPQPVFVTLSGDLLTHQFECRYRNASAAVSGPPQPDPYTNQLPTAPSPAPEAEVAAFAAKTVAFVGLQLRRSFAGVPVYMALGNNDSGCLDYRETPNSAFLKGFAQAMAVSATADPARQAQLVKQASPLGDYAVELPAPMEKARLIVLQNIFESVKFNTCAAAADRNPEREQIAWLRQQLADARKAGEHAWVMAHIPPAIDVYGSFHTYVLAPDRMCAAARITPFLDGAVAPDALANALTDFPDVVALAVFGHTHMDEIHLLRSPDGKSAVPAKLAPSISPINGNHPAFLAAEVDPATATLRDWRTIVSPGPQGSTPPWVAGYRFSTLYHLPDLSGASVDKLTAAMVADRTGDGEVSSAYRHNFSAGDLGLYSAGIRQIWPAYACTLRETRPGAVHSCMCPAK